MPQSYRYFLFFYVMIFPVFVQLHASVAIELAFSNLWRHQWKNHLYHGEPAILILFFFLVDCDRKRNKNDRAIIFPPCSHLAQAIPDDVCLT